MAQPSRAGRVYRSAVTALELFAATLLLVALLDMILQVGARTLLAGRAPTGTEEGLRVALVWITFSGAAVASLRGQHLVVDLFRGLPATVRRVWDLAIALLVAGLCAALLYGTAILTQLSWPNVTPGLGLTGSMYYIPLLLFAAVTLLHALAQAGLAITALARGAPAPEPEPAATPPRATETIE